MPHKFPDLADVHFPRPGTRRRHSSGQGERSDPGLATTAILFCIKRVDLLMLRPTIPSIGSFQNYKDKSTLSMSRLQRCYARCWGPRSPWQGHCQEHLKNLYCEIGKTCEKIVSPYRPVMVVSSVYKGTEAGMEKPYHNLCLNKINSLFQLSLIVKSYKNKTG